MKVVGKASKKIRRCFSISQEVRVNEEIKEKEVRVIGEDGSQLGVMPTRKALEMAEEAGLDLVEVAGGSKPVVCKILDFGKFKFEKGKKEKEAKKKQKVVVLKEVKMKPRIDTHDLIIKKKHIDEFIADGNKVKVTLVLSGREKIYASQGIEILEKLCSEFGDNVIIEKKYGESDAQKFLIISPKN